MVRENRFVATVRIHGKPVKVHVKNTGRCRELLVPGATVYLEKSDKPDRKTLYDLVSVVKGGRLINMDSQIPNAVAEEWIRGGGLFPEAFVVKREAVYGNSRFDLYVEYKDEDGGNQKAFVEVKGVTLEKGNVASFPDAPTKRGMKHVRELAVCREEGYEAYLLFIVQMKGVDYFTPAADIHPDFAAALREAESQGVHIMAYDTYVTPDSIVMGDRVEVRL